MKVVAVRKEKESNERFISRFNKKVQASRKILKVRSDRYHTSKPKKRYVRSAAVMREFYRKKKAVNKFY